jgi:hypothetical protein
VPACYAPALLDHAEESPDPMRSRPEAERRHLTVMFADLVGHLSRP